MAGNVLWAIVLGILAGVFIRSCVPLGFAWIGFCLLVGIAAAFAAYLDRHTRRQLVLVAIACVACAGGMARMHTAVLSGDPILTARLGERVTLEGNIVGEPDIRENAVRVSMRADSVSYANEATSSVDAGVLVQLPPHTGVEYGDRIRATGVLRLPESFETTGGRAFNYPYFLAKDGIVYELAFADADVIGAGSKNPLVVAALSLKRALQRGLGLALPEPEAGLAAGITVGDKRGVGQELTDVFRVAGITHIIVLSGYNIMVVIEALSRVLAYFAVHRYIRLGASALIAILFACMTGFASASVRAGAMAMIAVAGRMSGRMYLAGRALGAVAALMVLWNPFLLAFDPGFQLSIAATAGLIIFTPSIAVRMRFIPAAYGLREIAATTIAAQFAVLPLLLYQMGQLPVYSLFVNLLVLLVIPLAMLLSTIAGILALIYGTLGALAGLPAYALLAYVIGVAQLFAQLPFAAVEIPAFDVWWVFAAYGLMGILAMRIQKESAGGAGLQP